MTHITQHKLHNAVYLIEIINCTPLLLTQTPIIEINKNSFPKSTKEPLYNH